VPRNCAETPKGSCSMLSLYKFGDGVRFGYTTTASVSNCDVAIVPVAQKESTWDLFVVCQRGRISDPLRALLGALQLKTTAKIVNQAA